MASHLLITLLAKREALSNEGAENVDENNDQNECADEPTKHIPGIIRHRIRMEADEEQADTEGKNINDGLHLMQHIDKRPASNLIDKGTNGHHEQQVKGAQKYQNCYENPNSKGQENEEEGKERVKAPSCTLKQTSFNEPKEAIDSDEQG